MLNAVGECIEQVHREKLDMTKFFLHGNHMMPAPVSASPTSGAYFPSFRPCEPQSAIQTALGMHSDVYDKHTGDKHVSGFREL